VKPRKSGLKKSTAIARKATEAAAYSLSRGMARRQEWVDSPDAFRVSVSEA